MDKWTVLAKVENFWEVVVAQQVEWSIPTPEIRDSNPTIGKKFNAKALLADCRIVSTEKECSFV